MSNTPKIKQLEWRHLPSKQREEWIAEPIEDHLKYTIDKGKEGDYFILHINSFYENTKYTLAAAQHAAQADFEKKIGACVLWAAPQQ